jgi:hypothetical protein
MEIEASDVLDQRFTGRSIPFASPGKSIPVFEPKPNRRAIL